MKYTCNIAILAASTTQYQAYGQPCIMCGYPAQEIVIDYTEEEGDLVEEHWIPLCKGHMRPAAFTRLDGSTIDLETAIDEIRERLGMTPVPIGGYDEEGED